MRPKERVIGVIRVIRFIRVIRVIRVIRIIRVVVRCVVVAGVLVVTMSSNTF